MLTSYQGEVTCHTRLETALLGSQLVLESIAEDLDSKQELLREVAQQVGPKTVLATASMRLPVDQVFAKAAYKEVLYSLKK